MVICAITNILICNYCCNKLVRALLLELLGFVMNGVAWPQVDNVTSRPMRWYKISSTLHLDGDNEERNRVLYMDFTWSLDALMLFGFVEILVEDRTLQFVVSPMKLSLCLLVLVLF